MREKVVEDRAFSIYSLLVAHSWAEPDASGVDRQRRGYDECAEIALDAAEVFERKVSERMG